MYFQNPRPGFKSLDSLRASTSSAQTLVPVCLVARPEVVPHDVVALAKRPSVAAWVCEVPWDGDEVCKGHPDRTGFGRPT